MQGGSDKVLVPDEALSTLCRSQPQGIQWIIMLLVEGPFSGAGCYVYGQAPSPRMWSLLIPPSSSRLGARTAAAVCRSSVRCSDPRFFIEHVLRLQSCNGTTGITVGYRCWNFVAQFPRGEADELSGIQPTSADGPFFAACSHFSPEGSRALLFSIA